MAQARRPTDKLVKKLTRQEILDHADQLDKRRREQIDNQKKIINRMRDEIMVYDNLVTELRDDEANPTWLREAAGKCLALVDDVRTKHREQNKEKQDGE